MVGGKQYLTAGGYRQVAPNLYLLAYVWRRQNLRRVDVSVLFLDLLLVREVGARRLAGRKYSHFEDPGDSRMVSPATHRIHSVHTGKSLLKIEGSDLRGSVPC